MKCPMCNEEMSEGRIFYPNAFGLPWIPEQVPIPRIYDEKILERLGGLMIGTAGLSIHSLTVKTWVCRKCSKAIIDFSTQS